MNDLIFTWYGILFHKGFPYFNLDGSPAASRFIPRLCLLNPNLYFLPVKGVRKFYLRAYNFSVKSACKKKAAKD
jgi:hypothetical protein